MLKNIKKSFLVLGMASLFFANVILADNAPPVSHPTTLPRGIVLCVSLGMPDRVLRQYLKQAHELNIPIVIRGMLKNDMKTTSGRLFSLLNPPNEPAISGGIAIDPHPFRIAHIHAVPALVISNGYDFDVVSGNAPLSQLLHIAATDGSSDSLKAVAAADDTGEKEESVK